LAKMISKDSKMILKDEKILIINPFGIGDVLFTTPVIKALKRQYPDSFIGYWSNLRVKPILENNCQIDKVFALSRGDLKKIYQKSFFRGLWSALVLFWQIKKERFELCFDFSLDQRYSLLAKLIGIKKRVGFDYKGRGKLLTERVDLDSYHDKHVVEYYLDLLNFLNIQLADKNLSLTVPVKDKSEVRNIFALAGIEETDRVIGIFPGAGGSWGKDAALKHWPALKFAQVADKLMDSLSGLKVVILGDVSEREISGAIVQAMAHKPIDFVGKTSLEILPAIIKNCNLLITNDGGPMHLAVALGIKSVSVFGPVSEVVYGPYPASPEHVVLKYDLECRPCYRNFRLSVCDKDKECLRQVTVDAVFEAAARLLRGI
jgi:heptosyltransferase II